jgi:hypothetical protein
MNMPGFTAEASLYETRVSYMALTLNTVTGSEALLPQFMVSRLFPLSRTSSCTRCEVIAQNCAACEDSLCDCLCHNELQLCYATCMGRPPILRICDF